MHGEDELVDPTASEEEAVEADHDVQEWAKSAAFVFHRRFTFVREGWGRSNQLY